MAPQHAVAQSQAQAQQEAQRRQLELAKRRSRKPTDKTIPDGVEEVIIGDGVAKYRQLREIERKLDGAMMRKRMDIQDSRNSHMKRFRTLRIWISNTVEDQEWQGGDVTIDTFDFSAKKNGNYTVRIEGRLLDELDEDSDSESDDEEDEDKMDTDKKTPAASKYKLSHFFKSMSVEFKPRAHGAPPDTSVEWKKPILPPNARTIPPTADFDTLEFKRGGDENQNIVIKLVRDEQPERYKVSPALAQIIDQEEATRAEAVTGVWEYIKASGLQEDDEKRAFQCDELLKPIFKAETGYVPHITDVLGPHLTSLPPLELEYTIRCDAAYAQNPTPTIYDVRVPIDSNLRLALQAFTNNVAYAGTLQKVQALNDEAAVIVQALGQSKAKHGFLDGVARDPVGVLQKWVGSQKRDLDVILGEGARGGDPTGDEWRVGGERGVWAGEGVRQTVQLMMSSKGRGLKSID